MLHTIILQENTQKNTLSNRNILRKIEMTETGKI